jgi:hypothetical protein
MAVPMWPRPMNPTETGFAEPIPALCEDASPADPSIRFNHVATTAERHFSCFAVLGLFLRRTSVVD